MATTQHTTLATESVLRSFIPCSNFRYTLWRWIVIFCGFAFLFCARNLNKLRRSERKNASKITVLQYKVCAVLRWCFFFLTEIKVNLRTVRENEVFTNNEMIFFFLLAEKKKTDTKITRKSKKLFSGFFWHRQHRNRSYCGLEFVCDFVFFFFFLFAGLYTQFAAAFLVVVVPTKAYAYLQHRCQCGDTAYARPFNERFDQFGDRMETLHKFVSCIEVHNIIVKMKEQKWIWILRSAHVSRRIENSFIIIIIFFAHRYSVENESIDWK